MNGSRRATMAVKFSGLVAGVMEKTRAAHTPATVHMWIGREPDTKRAVNTARSWYEGERGPDWKTGLITLSTQVTKAQTSHLSGLHSPVPRQSRMKRLVFHGRVSLASTFMACNAGLVGKYSRNVKSRAGYLSSNSISGTGPQWRSSHTRTGPLPRLIFFSASLVTLECCPPALSLFIICFTALARA